MGDEVCVVKQGLGFEDHQTMVPLDTCCTVRQLISLSKQSIQLTKWKKQVLSQSRATQTINVKKTKFYRYFYSTTKVWATR